MIKNKLGDLKKKENDLHKTLESFAADNSPRPSNDRFLEVMGPFAAYAKSQVEVLKCYSL